MKKQISSASRIIGFQELKRNWIKHEERLMHIKPTLNTRPAQARYLTSRKCNYSKSLEVELQNKALLKKLTDRSDHRHDQSICVTTPLRKSNRKKFYEEYKKKFQDQGLSRRLKEIKPIIDTERMLSQRKITEKYLNNISKFGYKGFKPNKTQLRFDMKNNELKYLSKRKIMIQSRIKEFQQKNSKEKLPNEMKIIDLEYQKMKRNQRLFNKFMKAKPILVDGYQVLLKITEGSKAILLQLKNSKDKQNIVHASFELQVRIDKSMFENKFKNDLWDMLTRLKYNQNTQNFYLL